MKIVMVLLVWMSCSWAIQTSEKLFECTKIFEERKGELLVELERIDEQRQALDALKIATDELLRKKEAALTAKEAEVDAKLADLNATEANIKAMLEANEKVLEAIREAKMSKVTQTYAKMKAGAAAQILDGMPEADAANILMALKPAVMGKILAKMPSAKASQITLLLAEDDANTTRP